MTEPTISKIQTGYKAWIADPNRAKQNVDFGLWWEYQTPGQKWRVSWSRVSGELYACLPRLDQYIVLGKYFSRQDVDKVMEGWADAESPIYHNLQALIEHIASS